MFALTLPYATWLLSSPFVVRVSATCFDVSPAREREYRRPRRLNSSRDRIPQSSTAIITSLRLKNQSVQGGSYWASDTGPMARK